MQQMDEFEIKKNRIANSFAQAAITYDKFAVLQRDVADKLLGKINKFKQPERILDLGCGTGYCTKVLKTFFPKAEIISLDIAEGMLVYAKSQNLTTSVCADAEFLPFTDNSFDLIVSSLAIQWCKSYTKLFDDLHRVLRVDGEIHISTFGPDTLQELKQAWSGLDNYVHVNRFAEMKELEKILIEENYSEIKIEKNKLYRHYGSLKSLTQELKAIGAHNMNQGQAQGLGGRQKVSRLKKNFESNFIPELGIPVTYEVYNIYLSNKK